MKLPRLTITLISTAKLYLGRGDDTVGSPHRARNSQFELFELIHLSKLDKRFPVERFEATESQSTVPSPPLIGAAALSASQPCSQPTVRDFPLQGISLYKGFPFIRDFP